jgi:hypothetical protein
MADRFSPLSRCALTLVVAVALVTAPLAGQEGTPPRTPGERLGTVHLSTSCAPAVSPSFDRAVALLHSFEFAASIRGFEGVLAADPNCAMAWWGIALARWTNPMVPNVRPPAALERGLRAAEAGARVGVHATDRERSYLSAVTLLYADAPRLDQRTRLRAYAAAMATLAAQYPDDMEARIFYALALVGGASPADKSYVDQRKAGAMLESLFAVHPDHPGLAHYIIHSYDVPALAPRAEAAARRYAEIAPSAAHALHMPSHTFTRVGMWRESVGTNLRSMEAALREGSMAEALHAADYAVYADLQMRRDSEAGAILARLPEFAARFDPRAATGAAPGSAGVFALAAIPARYALERRAWSEAAGLHVAASDFPYAEALTYFARALGAARLGDTIGARASVDSLESIRTRLHAVGEGYWAEQVAIQRLGAAGWLAAAAGREHEGLAELREAAAREDATEKAAVTPGPLIPAHELLGDLLLSLHHPADALVEYRTALTREPNRYHSVEGAAHAAAAAGDQEAAASYGQQLEALARRLPPRR